MHGVPHIWIASGCSVGGFLAGIIFHHYPIGQSIFLGILGGFLYLGFVGLWYAVEQEKESRPKVR